MHTGFHSTSISCQSLASPLLSRALKNLNKFRLHGKQITLAWAPGKGMKEKQWKEFWDLDAGASFIPIEKLDPQVGIINNHNKSVWNKWNLFR